MLDGAGNADRDIERWGEDLAGLADVPVVRGLARIDGSARCADGSFSRSASSTEISSNGFIDIFALASSTPEPSGLTRIFTL